MEYKELSYIIVRRYACVIPIAVAVRSKAWVCGPSVAGIVG